MYKINVNLKVLCAVKSINFTNIILYSQLSQFQHSCKKFSVCFLCVQEKNYHLVPCSVLQLETAECKRQNYSDFYLQEVEMVHEGSDCSDNI